MSQLSPTWVFRSLPWCGCTVPCRKQISVKTCKFPSVWHYRSADWDGWYILLRLPMVSDLLVSEDVDALR
ncbi:unnamed protein product [Colias eurytheme]|nr:unnamed protein product [Colias eurytheme]